MASTNEQVTSVQMTPDFQQSQSNNGSPLMWCGRRLRKTGLDIKTGVGCLIVCLFVVALLVMVILTDGCIIENNNRVSCSNEEETKPDLNGGYYCNDIKDFDCFYLSDKEEIHVHVVGEIIRCRSVRFRSSKLSKIVMWDLDKFLHFGDDRLADCTVLEQAYFTCHFRGQYLIEGISEANPPDLYFKIFVNDTDFCGEGRDECVVSTKDLGSVTPREDANKCASPDLDNIHISDNSQITRQLDAHTRFFREISQQDNWTIWKCYVRIYMNHWDQGEC